MAESIKAQLSFSKTSCYLCSEWLDDDEIENHLFECNSKSVTCPEGCGTVVLRQNMHSHWKRCTKSFGETHRENNQENDNYTNTTIMDSKTSSSISNEVNFLGEELQYMQLAYNDDVHQRVQLMAQLEQLKKRFELADKWTAKVNAALVSFNKLVSHETKRRSVDFSVLEERQNQQELWRLDLTTRFNSIESKFYSSPESKPPCSLNDVSALQQQVERVEYELLHLQGSKKRMNYDSHSKKNIISSKMGNGNNSCEMPPLAEERRSTDLESIQAILDGVVEKQANYACRLQDALQQLFMSEERVLKMSQQLEKYRRETYYTKQRLETLQANLKLEEQFSALSGNDGRIIWRIDEFEKRFLESKDNGIMLKGPVFTNQPFGYVLQLEVSLFGIGTWRGRNLIAGLTVLKGSYDTLLEWPCMLRGTIRLRDQPDQRSNAMDICKPIIAKRKSKQTDEHQYVYIPHDVLRSRHFIRDDTIFLEVIFGHDLQDTTVETFP